MKHLFFISTLVFLNSTFAQSNTDIHLFDLNASNGKINLSNHKNISNNEGYDNQPSFLSEDKVLFASTRNGQTDIAQYHINYKSKIFINSTEGGEYTPLKIPNKNAVSAVRLDKDGKQALYSYNLSNGEPSVLIEGLVVAYYTWYNENIIVSAVIEGDDLNLYVINVTEGTSKQYATKVGRSFHKIPNSNLVSYISKTDENQWQIWSLNPLTGKTRLLANTIEGIEDICWLNSNTILSGKDNFLYKLTLRKDNNWKKIADLSSNGIKKITRLVTNTNATKILIAGDITSESNNETKNANTNQPNTTPAITEDAAARIVQKHIDPFNNRQLDNFAKAFNDNVMVKRFPDEYMYSGRNTLKENYRQFFKNYKKSNIKVLNRIILKNKVIDEELVTIDNKTVRQATIYEVDEKGIKSMIFIRNKKATSNPEIIVNKQLEKYNERDIDGFAQTYANDIKLYRFPDTILSEGEVSLRKDYASLFERIPDLNAEIDNRIVLGNKVIDKEKVTFNGQTFYAIAIYEVENDKITKVTFIQ